MGVSQYCLTRIFDRQPSSLRRLASQLDMSLVKRNVYGADQRWTFGDSLHPDARIALADNMQIDRTQGSVVCPWFVSTQRFQAGSGKPVRQHDAKHYRVRRFS